ncbi:MAG: hypothetical protein ACE144_21200 [Thermodesulfobacteriota bacterium]
MRRDEDGSDHLPRGLSVKSKALEGSAKELAKLAKDSRLTEAENAALVEKLSEVREAFIELLLKKRVKSHDRDFVAG